MRWGVSDFKGLKYGSLEFKSGVLTVLAGTNSSGKSSLIQSLLMAAQSLHSEGPVVLNGPLARLGEAADLVRDGAEATKLSIQFSGHRRQRGSELFEADEGEESSELAVDMELREGGQGDTLALHRLEIKDGEGECTLVLSKRSARSGDREAVAEIVNAPDIDVLHVKSLLNSSDRQLRTYVAFRGLVPVSLVQLHKPEDMKRAYRSEFDLALRQLREPDENVGPYSAAHLSLARELASVRRRENKRSEPWRAALTDLLTALREGGSQMVSEALGAVERDQDEIVDSSSRDRATAPYVQIRFGQSGERREPMQFLLGLLERSLFRRIYPSLWALSELARELDRLSSKTQYLGPLRDEPRVVWTQWNEQARGLPVGARGEYSAAVLARRGHRTIRYTDPSGEDRQASLMEAVNEWVRALQIGEQVSAQSRGKLGVGVAVEMKGASRDLTSVGVGVSQALPLIVGYLSAPKQSIFLVEQPELHLHPALQSRLADFLLRARPDITTVVETHSEALLTRIRRRVAEQVLDAKSVRILFIEPEVGGARSRSLALGDYGDLSDWPEGFMSGADEDTTAILAANVSRVAR